MSEQQLLQQAIDVLRIHDVYLRSSDARLADGFEPKYDPGIDRLEIQFKHLVAQSSVLNLHEDTDEGAEPLQLFRVHVELGSRWVDTETSAEGEEQSVKAEINATMIAEYVMSEDPGPDALKLFALKNASFHIWPYWREYLTMQCLRMNLPKLVLPTVQFASNHEDQESHTE